MRWRSGRGWQLLRSVRARLMVLLAIAAIPLVALAAVIVWQNFAVTVTQAMQVALLAREAATARHEAALEGVRQMLTAISQAEAIRSTSDGRCAGFLSDLLALNADRYAEILVADEEGRVRCEADVSG